MKVFYLKVSDGEIINRVYTKSIDDAIEIFALQKNLSIEQLLKIFVVSIAKDEKK